MRIFIEYLTLGMVGAAITCVLLYGVLRQSELETKTNSEYARNVVTKG